MDFILVVWPKSTEIDIAESFVLKLGHIGLCIQRNISLFQNANDIFLNNEIFADILMAQPRSQGRHCLP